MKQLLVYYNFIIATTFVLLALFNARTLPELVAGVLYSPLLIYFILLVLPGGNHAARIKNKSIIAQKFIDDEPSSIKMPKFDMDRRLFLKLIASSGISFFLFSLFTGKADKAFFGTAPNPTTGVPKYPTDGYQITEIDDSTPTYYGYVNKEGAWFIRKEDMDGSFRYTKGPSDFITNWTNRASLRYDYFNTVF